MRKLFYFIPLLLMFSSCGEYNKVLKSKDVDYRFDFAKRAFDKRNFTQAATVLETIYTPLRGGPNGEEALFLLAMSYYENKDYLNSGLFFKTYYSRYPKGKYTELARFYSGYGYYLDSPDPQLDQSQTVKAIEELQGFLDFFPDSDRVSIAQNAIFEMQDKLTLKELQNAQLYYNSAISSATTMSRRSSPRGMRSKTILTPNSERISRCLSSNRNIRRLSLVCRRNRPTGIVRSSMNITHSPTTILIQKQERGRQYL